MKLFAIPFACSMASHIALREAALPHEIRWVRRGLSQLEDGADYRHINPKGKVAALLLDDGSLISENPAVLLCIADAAGGPTLNHRERLQLYEWLGFINSEIHKQVLWAHFDPHVPAPMKEHAVQRLLPALLSHLDAALSERPFLVGASFTIADAYLFWALFLIAQTRLAPDQYPALAAFRARVGARPAVQDALAVEAEAYARAKKAALAQSA